MKKTILAAFLLAATSTAALAQAGAPPKPNAEPALDTGKLTILEVINIGQALQQLGSYFDGRQKVDVPFKFDGATLMTFAVNIRASDDAKKAYQEGYAKFEAQEIGDVKDMKPEDVQQKKQAIAASDAAARMMSRPAGALLARIKESELCMKSPPVAPCTVKNDIPPALVAVLLPIVDRGQ